VSRPRGSFGGVGRWHANFGDEHLGLVLVGDPLGRSATGCHGWPPWATLCPKLCPAAAARSKPCTTRPFGAGGIACVDDCQGWGRGFESRRPLSISTINAIKAGCFVIAALQQRPNLGVADVARNTGERPPGGRGHRADQQRARDPTQEQEPQQRPHAGRGGRRRTRRRVERTPASQMPTLPTRSAKRRSRPCVPPDRGTVGLPPDSYVCSPRRDCAWRPDSSPSAPAARQTGPVPPCSPRPGRRRGRAGSPSNGTSARAVRQPA
jgi:hypothetical protein